MFKKELFSLWGILFILCAGIGFIPDPQGAVKWVLILLSIGFFVPPMVLMYQSQQQGDQQTVSLIRNLSALSLGLTVVLLILNFLSIGWHEAVGDILYVMLVIVSTPMVSSQFWALSLFFWACLLMMSFTKLIK